MKHWKLVALVCGLAAAVSVLLYLRRDWKVLGDLEVESNRGLQCMLKHEWFGETWIGEAAPDKLGWRRFVPGWRIEELDFLREGYQPEETTAITRAVNRLSGPRFVDIVSQADKSTSKWLWDIEPQPDVVQVVVLRSALSRQTWTLLFEKFPNVKEMEIIDASMASDMSKLLQLEQLQLRNCNVADEALLSLARLPALRSVYILAEDTTDARITPEGLARFCHSAPALEEIIGVVDFEPRVLDEMLGDLAFAKPRLRFAVVSRID